MFDDEELEARENLLENRYREGYLSGIQHRLSQEPYVKLCEKQDSLPGIYGFMCGYRGLPIDLSWLRIS